MPNNHEITIKTASLQDLKEKERERIIELMNVFVEKQGRRISVADVVRTMERPEYTLITAVTKQGIIVGAVGLIEINLFTGKTGILDELVVDPKFQSRGIATKLIEHLIELAKEKRMSHVKLDITSENSANNLYMKMGFEKKDDNIYKLYLFHLYK
ncbi:MAG: GNAT family N-acetyltransferase [Patescibacteria group bacterium]|nr:GNAT family N-acetyltransferase [Patescibacteria group bacterium]